LIKEFEPTNPETYANFIDAVRSRRASDLQGDILQGHLSAALVHMANISYRLGKLAPGHEIKERIGAHRELSSAYDRFQGHLAANGIDLEKTHAAIGPLLTMDPDTERFVGEFGAEANQFVSRDYREPFVVPAKV